jgi:hypothetical protein
MRFELSIALIVVAGLTSLVHPAAAASSRCPQGMVTCQQWCAMHPERTTCMTGHPNSCDKKPQGPRTCVRI